MATALCSRTAAAAAAVGVPNENLVSLLQDSISCVADDAFHPVLYQALSGLHDYVGNHQQKLLVQGFPAKAASTSDRQWKKPRPSFWRVDSNNTSLGTSSSNKGIVTYGWMYEMISRSEGRGSVLLDEVILLLVAPKREEPYLRICQEIISDNSPPQMETRNRAPLRNLIIDYEEVFGDPRLVLTTEEGETITLRCGSSLSAQSWVLEIQRVLKEDAAARASSINHHTAAADDDPDPEILNQSVEVERDENNTDIVHVAAADSTNTTNNTEELDKNKDKGRESCGSPTTPSKQDAEEKVQELETPILTPDSISSNLSISSYAKEDTKDKQQQQKQQKPLSSSPSPPPTPPSQKVVSQPVVQQQQAERVPQPTQRQVPQNQQQPFQNAPQSAQQTTNQAPKVPQPTKQKQGHPSHQGVQLAQAQERAQAQAQAQASSDRVSQQQQKPRQPQQPQQQQQPKQQQQQQRLQIQQQQQQKRQQEQQQRLQQQRLAQQQQHQQRMQQQHAKAALPAPTTQIGKEMLVEQQKKLAAERRKQDLESQRKLAREEQKGKDLQAKRKFLEKEQRKQELVAKNQRPNASNDTSANLKQITQQMAAIDAEIQQVAIRANAIKKEIEQRKNQPLQLPTLVQKPAPGAAAAAAEQRRRGQDLEAKKKAATEKRRRELEEQRRKAREEQKRIEDLKKQRFLEHEQRKQDLMAKAKQGKVETKDSALFQKLSNQLSGLDAETERKREEEATKAKQEAEAADPEIARQRIAERAKQQELQEEMKRTSNYASEMGQGPGVSLAQSGSSDMGQGSRVTPAQSASSEEGGLGKTPSWDQPPQQQQQPAFNTSLSSHGDPFEHLQAPAQQTRYPQQSMPHQAVPQQAIPNHSPRYGRPPHQQYQQHMQPQLPRGGAMPFGSNTTPPSPSSPHYYSNLQQQQGQYPFQQPTHNHMYHSSSPSQATQGQPTPEAVQPTQQPQPPQPQPQPQPQPHPQQQPNPRPQQPDPVTNSKYAPSGGDDEEDDQSAQTELKRKIIVGWGLQPPEMQGLRQINELLCTIQTVFPPANDLPAHKYFSGWKAISDSGLREGPGLDEKKLSKAVRKLRFFLHPDKLPRDLTDEQHFVCKLLWDITNDAWADYKKALEDLDWM